MRIEVAYALPDEQWVLAVTVEAICTVGEAIHSSGILERFPDIDLTHNKVGIFGQQASLDALLREGDRVEVYRPLLIDPKQARRVRAQQSNI